MRPIGSSLERGLKAFIDTLPWGIVMAEVGCFCGESTRMFLTKASKMFCVDPWADYVEDNGPMGKWKVVGMADIEAKFDAEVSSELQSGKVVKFKMPSVHGARAVPGMLDLVYLDGNHSFDMLLEDIIEWVPKVKIGGIVSGHDYDRQPVKEAVNAFFGSPDRVFEDFTWAFTLGRRFTVKWVDSVQDFVQVEEI